MNQRIRELAEQAGFMVDQSGNIMVCFTSNGDSEVEKLALLIVKECADWIENEEDEQGDYIHDSFYWAPRLLKHFGVE